MNDRLPWFLLAVALLAASLSQCAHVPRAEAQAAPWEGVSDALALARICRHEAGFPVRRGRGAAAYWEHGDDCAAIDLVIERVRARREASLGRPVSYAEAVHVYSGRRIFDRSRTDAACDVAWIDESGEQPACWRAGVPWSSRRDAWLAMLGHARAIRAGEVMHRCARPPLHWGCGYITQADGTRVPRCRDHERAARAGWVECSCGQTDNTFYCEAL